MTDVTESRLDEMASKIAALEEEVTLLKRRVRVTRKKLRKADGRKKAAASVAEPAA